MRQIKPALQHSEGRSKPWSGSTLINCFSEKADGDKEVDFAVMAIPGLPLFGALGSDACRGAHVMAGVLYVIAGALLYAVASDGSSTAIGYISGSGPVRMDDSGSQLAICAAPIGYVYDGVTLASPSGLPMVSDVAYLDGYMVWTVYNSNQFVFSEIGDAMVYDPLDVATVAGAPGNLVGVINNHRELMFFKNKTLEIWYDSGDADNPIQRQGNAFIERGTLDRDSIVKIDNSVHFMGNDRIVYRLAGYEPQRISTHAIEFSFRAADIARAFEYTQEGHKFYVISSNDVTMVFDMATGAWHERKSYNLPTWRVSASVDAYGTTVFCDRYTGNLYRPDFDTYTEAGDPIRVEIGLPSVDSGNRSRVTMYAFEVYCETGVGLSVGQGSDPKIVMLYSKNGGRTWSNEMERSLGVIGDYEHRAVWRPGVQFRQIDIRLYVTDPVRRFMISYWIDAR